MAEPIGVEELAQTFEAVGAVSDPTMTLDEALRLVAADGGRASHEVRVRAWAIVVLEREWAAGDGGSSPERPG